MFFSEKAEGKKKNTGLCLFPELLLFIGQRPV